MYRHFQTIISLALLRYITKEGYYIEDVAGDGVVMDTDWLSCYLAGFLRRTYAM